MDYPWIILKSSVFLGGSSGGDPAVHWDGTRENLDETSELRDIPMTGWWFQTFLIFHNIWDIYIYIYIYIYIPQFHRDMSLFGFRESTILGELFRPFLGSEGHRMGRKA